MDLTEKSVKVFCCYAREDQVYLHELRKHLSPLEREGRITLWADIDISAGTEWKQEIERHLNAAHIILLLISPDFIASDYCYSVEMRRAMQRHNLGVARVIPIILRPVNWQETPFGKLQVLPMDGIPATHREWHHLDEAFYNITEGIRKAVAETASSLRKKAVAERKSSNSKTPPPPKRVNYTPVSRESGLRPANSAKPLPSERTSFKSVIERIIGRPINSKIPPPQTDAVDELMLYTVLNIDSTYAKAMIVEIQDDIGVVLGVGRYPQSYSYMSDGIVTDIPGVIANCNEALLRAEEAAGGLIAPNTVIGIAGELVKGASITVTEQRSYPDKPITEEELVNVISRAEQKLLKNARERIAVETGYPNIEVRAVQAGIISMSVAGYQKISNPIGFRSPNLSLTLFSTFAPLMQLGALQTVAQSLDLTLVTIVAGPYALARSLCNGVGNDRGAILIDVNEGTTDIALVREGGIEETRMFALGGRTFTRRLVTHKGISLKEATKLKSNYEHGLASGSERKEIQQIFAPEVQTWIDSVELLIEELAKGELLPPAIYMLGSSSRLPDLYEKLVGFPWTERLPFSHLPSVQTAQLEMVTSIVDPKHLLIDSEDIMLMALAYQAIELQEEDDILAKSLSKVLRNLNIQPWTRSIPHIT